MKRSVTFAMLLGAAALLASACGRDESGRASAQTTATTTPTDAAMERLAGRYAHYDVVAYEGKIMNSMIISYGFTDLDVVDGELVANDSFCFSEFRSDQPISVTFSDAATSAIKPIPSPVKLTTGDDGTVHLSRPETPTGIGIRLEHPATDQLPSDPADPRIADDDGDGKPGVTAKISLSGGVEGEIYIARREIFAYEVDEQPDGSLEGQVRDRSEQLVVGASNDIFLTQDPWTQHSDLSKSPIILRPVDRNWDCARLRSERDAMFPPTPNVDY
jgi:hypothetical protein